VTVNPDSTREFNIGELVSQCYKVAGLVNFSQAVDPARASFAKDLLEGIIKHLEAQGLQVRAADFLNVELTAGTERYTLPDNVLDVIGDAAYVPGDALDVDRADGETQIRLISMDKWQKLSSHAAQGRPTLLYPHRQGAQVEARLWPIPQENATARLQVQLLYPNASDSNTTTGLERPWHQFFKFALAHELALSNSKPLERCVYLKAQADQFLVECKGFSNQRANGQFRLSHGGNNRWRR
jgi:hypothetical protein